MGQVPQNPRSAGLPGERLFPLGVIGDGRLAVHFTHYLNLLQIPFRQWSRRLQAREGQSLESRLQGCETILILLSDSVIEPFISESIVLRGRRLVHCSGALLTPLAQGFHPLMSFGPELYGREEYEAICFVCEKGPLKFRDVFPMLPNPSFELPPELKARYHADCVLAGNFTVLLWQKLFTDFSERLGLPREAALPYLRRIMANLERDPGRALTGPLQRGDHHTIEKNLAALEGDAFQGVYRAFVEAHGNQSVGKGAL